MSHIISLGFRKCNSEIYFVCEVNSILQKNTTFGFAKKYIRYQINSFTVIICSLFLIMLQHAHAKVYIFAHLNVRKKHDKTNTELNCPCRKHRISLLFDLSNFFLQDLKRYLILDTWLITAKLMTLSSHLCIWIKV